MARSAVADVSETAHWVAVYRAEESERPDALFKDPWAGRLAGDRGHQIASQIGGSQYVRWSVVTRTVVIDAFIRDRVASGVDAVLNLGAGLDTRPYRMSLPASLKWIEVDYPHMIDFKEGMLQGEKPTCQLERVRLDLS